MNEHTSNKGFDRYLYKIDVWAMAFGCMIGWGAFVMPGTTFLPVAGPLGTIIAMIIGLIVILVIAYSVSYLMERSPRTGGFYSYTKEAFGRDHAFLCSWFLCLSYLTIVFLNGTALFLVIRTIMDDSVTGEPLYTIAGNPVYAREIAYSIGALAGVGLLFIVAKSVLQRLLTVLSVILALGAVVTTLFCLPAALASGAIGTFGLIGVNKGYAIFSLVILAPWAFVGFEITSFDTAHFRFPVRKSKYILFTALILGAFVYSAMTLVSISVVPDGYASWADYIANLDEFNGVMSVPTFYAARSIMGTTGLVVIGITALAAILTGIIGAYRATMRVLSTMAEDRILHGIFSNTAASIVFIMVLSILISFLGRNTLSWFVDLTSFGAIVAYGYTSAAAFKIARTEGRRKIMITGAIGTAIAILFAFVQLVPHLLVLDAMGSEAFLLLSLWCLLGFVFYWRTIRRSSLTEYSGMSISGTVLFSLLVYSALLWLAKSIERQESSEDVQRILHSGGILVLIIIFIGLTIMLYIQNLVRVKHEAVEREKIRAVEGSLAKSQFLFNMSHDIRTPMNAILGYTSLALKEPTSDEQRDYLTKIEASSQHLLALINDILEMSRIESGKIELEYAPADLCNILDDLYDLFAEQMKQKNMDFSIHTTQVQDRYVWCDRKNLNRVLLNLISNAYKFTPENGTISASIYETGVDDNGYGAYELRIQDTGIGMSKEFVEKMFHAFERERSSTVSGIEGTGLGLAITKSIVDLMGGTIEVLTSPGSGTQIILRFKFRLASEEDIRIGTAKDESDTGDDIDFTGMRLLLVEDNAINMEIAKMILEQMGFTVESAENGRIAVDMVAESDPGYYDAVLMDIQMPVMDGYTAAREIRSLPDAEKAATPILAMTANAFKEDVHDAENAGMQAHIAKPIDIDILSKTLNTVLKK